MDYPQRGQSRTYTYVWVRKDLPMHYQIIQTGHALHEIGLQQNDNGGNNYIVLFEVKNEAELCSISKFLGGLGVKHHMFYEPDHNTGHTAIATRLIGAEEPVRKQFADFKMWEDKSGIKISFYSGGGTGK